MAAFFPISQEMTEPERRRLVADIAGRTKRTTEAAETTKAPIRDWAAAGRSLVASDPVDLGGAAARDLNAQGSAVAQNGTRFAELQRAIFQRSTDADRGMQEAALDQFGNRITATNAELTRYEEALRADAAARAAAASRRTSRRPSNSGSSSDLWIPGGDNTSADGVQGYAPLTTWQEDRSVEVYDELGPDDAAAMYDSIESAVQQALDQGDTWADTYFAIVDGLIGSGYTREEAVNFLAPIANQWQPLFGASPADTNRPRSFGR